MDIWKVFPRKIRKRVAAFYLKAADCARSIRMYLKYLGWYSIHKKDPEYHSIPIVINNFNRVSSLKKLIDTLENRGYRNIYIIDNNSTFPALLDYYSTCSYPIFYLRKNLGFTAIWDSGLYNRFKRSFYVYTDSDIILDKDCPEDFMKVFLDALRKYPKCKKVGFGLRIDDLPDAFSNKQKVIEHESQFWRRPVDDLFYDAPIDTTFALYRPFCYGPADSNYLMLRSNTPYLAQHTPWYVDSANLSEEELYYLKSCSKSTHWSQLMKNN